MTSPAGNSDVVAKKDFAAIINVSRARVSQFIRDGRISGDSLEGTGRHAKIHVERAKAQLRQQLDVSQMTGNGLDTRLGPVNAASQAGTGDLLPRAQTETSVPPSAPAQPSPLTADTVEDQIKREKLRQAQMKTRREAAQEAEEEGRFMTTADARQQMGRIASGMIQTFEGSLADIAAALSQRFKLPNRDVVHVLRAEFRTIRSRAAAQAAKTASELPDKHETPVDAPADSQEQKVEEVNP